MHDCHFFKWPSTREDFWRKKITDNALRDKINEAKLREKEWRIARVWECALKGKHKQSIDSVLEDCALWLKSNKSELDIRGNE